MPTLGLDDLGFLTPSQERTYTPNPNSSSKIKGPSSKGRYIHDS